MSKASEMVLYRTCKRMIQRGTIDGLAEKIDIKNAAKFSQHLYGKAADIWISGVTVEQIAAYAETLLPNRGGIGRYPKEGHADRTHGWVHIDTRAAKSRWVS